MLFQEIGGPLRLDGPAEALVSIECRDNLAVDSVQFFRAMGSGRRLGLVIVQKIRHPLPDRGVIRIVALQ